MEASKFNQTMFKGLLYLFILMFAYQCASNPIPQTNKDENKSITEKESYIDDLVSGNKYSSDGLEKKNITENIFIAELQSELHTNKSEIQNLRSIIKSLSKQVESQQINKNTEQWNASLGIYNQEIIMQSGTVYYGNIIYQDDEYVTLETLIGKLNIDRAQITRVVSHKMPKSQDSIDFPDISVGASVSSIEDGTLLYKKPAEVILIGNITSYNDDDGSTKLSGNVKNIGGKRADFVKLNITLYRDWSQKLQPKTFSVFVNGETHYLNPEDSTMVSLNSLSPKSEAGFELHVPQNFGTVMSWTYDIDYEEYE